ncbi:fibroblast growth factor-binding protein 2 [Ochotona princeps]|uniref:fibroblast growth factor-binding protein 2 n=1 Tax=Ochotona princeps TaxID=9978 RepID=UPI002714C3E9|nr:fibroblast growth factor-binding protein 2 [Ochotona princeps]
MKSVLCMLLLALCCLGTWGQSPRPKPGHSLEEFPFQTRRHDSCIMRISLSGQGAREIRLRVDCHGQHQVYWCEWSGQPDTCPAFVANPKLYWTQVLQQLRHLDHACQEAPVLKPSVCRQAGPQAHLQQMASSLRSIPAPSQHPQTAKAKKPSQRPTAPVEPVNAAQLGNAVSSPQSTVKANQPEFRGNKEAEKMARELFWEPLRAVLAFLISLFRG